MDYEQKYEQKYREALGWMRSLYDGLHGATKEDAEHYFPELKESKDERIRKELIEQVAYIIPNDDEVDGEGNTLPTYQKRIDKYRAWLEKQGEQTHAELSQQEVTKTSDQELSDKIEPKFKAGDWIVINETTYQIIEIDNSHVALSFNGRECNFGLDVFNNARLWTIQEAKDGDVLYLQHEGVEHIIIYKRLFKKNFHTILSVRCAYDGSTNDFFEDVDYYHCITSERDEKEIHPATKEQRDLLFSKMKEAGYEWDSEKKELKKIEDKTLDADKVIEWLKNTIKETKEYINDVHYDTRLILPYNYSIEDLINDFKEDFGL